MIPHPPPPDRDPWAPDGTPTCEFALRVDASVPGPELAVVCCGRVAVRRYPCATGGWMYLCLEHAKPHVAYAERCYEGEREPAR